MDSAILSHAIYIYSTPLSFILGIQYAWAGLVSAVYLPVQSLSSLCLLPDDLERGAVLSRTLFLSGLATLIQSLFGVRCPVLVSPSLLFSAAIPQLLHTSYWEHSSDGDLYAMGLELREQEFTGRSNEIRAAILISAFLSAIAVGMLWYLRAKAPSCTVYAALLCLSITNITHLTPTFTNQKQEQAFLALLSLFLLIVFYICRNLGLSCFKVISTEDHKVKLKAFKLFPVLLTFLIGCCILQIVQWEEPSLAERATAPHHWLSFLYIPTDFNTPVFSLRALVFLPTLLAQALGSYCSYALLTQHPERAAVAEYVLNILSASLGGVFQLAVDPTSLGLSALSQVKNPESTVISGSLMIVMASFLKALACSSQLPFIAQCAIGIYLHTQLIAKVLLEVQKDKSDCLQIVVFSTASGLVISSFTKECHENIIFSVLTLLLKKPVLVTFILSFLLNTSCKGTIKSK